MDSMEPLLMTRPRPPRFRCGCAARLASMALVRLVSMTVRQSSSRYSSGRRRMLVPALFTRMSSPPRRVAVASTMAPTAASSVMSATTESAFAPSDESSATAAAFFPASRPATITAAPHRARPRARPRPMPPLPPVTSATRPDRSNMPPLIGPSPVR